MNERLPSKKYRVKPACSDHKEAAIAKTMKADFDSKTEELTSALSWADDSVRQAREYLRDKEVEQVKAQNRLRNHLQGGGE